MRSHEQHRAADQIKLDHRVAGFIVGGVYIAGTWVYGIWYIWEYWSRDIGYGLLAWYGFMRALIWPVWVALALV